MIERLRIDHWLDVGRIWRGVGYAFMLSLFTLATLMLVYVINRAYFNDPDVRVQNLDGMRLALPVCPGERLNVHSRITVERPVLLFSYFSVMDRGRNHNYNGTQIANGALPHPHAASFTQTMTWTVPSLSPGIYSRVLAFRGTDGRENSIFVWTEFEIGEDCDNQNPDIPANPDADADRARNQAQRYQ